MRSLKCVVSQMMEQIDVVMWMIDGKVPEVVGRCERSVVQKLDSKLENY